MTALSLAKPQPRFEVSCRNDQMQSARTFIPKRYTEPSRNESQREGGEREEKKKHRTRVKCICQMGNNFGTEHEIKNNIWKKFPRLVFMCFML